jgi:integrase
MASIRARRQADGTLRYTAEVRLRKGKRVIHREAKTFTHRTAAEKWAKSREVCLEDPTALVRAQHGEKSLSQLIRWYIDQFGAVSKWQRTKQSQLEFLEKHPIGTSNALALTSATLIDHVRARRAAGAGPATAGNDLTWIGVVLRAAKSVQQVPVDPEIVEHARTACRELRLVAKSKRRDRRPTDAELAKLDAHFRQRDARAEIPMRDIMWFAIYSARRESEICRLEWTDNDTNARTGLVRDAKHPRSKEGNHKRFKYTPEAWEIAHRQPQDSDYIFPYDPKSVGAAFTCACHILGIQDLRFHDLRHDATSRLFERGYQIHEVAQFTLHDSWNELKRYTNLRPEKVREIPARAAEASANGSPPLNDGSSSTPPSGVADQSAPPDRSRSRATAISDPQA